MYIQCNEHEYINYESLYTAISLIYQHTIFAVICLTCSSVSNIPKSINTLTTPKHQNTPELKLPSSRYCR